ncbi:MAG: putative AGC family protein kinase [Streblomastix strix]|uniref:Putative AGC family protein kinase n=1 Tax=Streblomastix strix TaxID=222440 RepID=A0A5J4WCT1_9EUKA|nr:MAG: putative AGC family protein kinase [Streblomastix strix]
MKDTTIARIKNDRTDILGRGMLVEFIAMIQWARKQNNKENARNIQSGVCEIITIIMSDNSDAIELALNSDLVNELMILLRDDLPIEEMSVIHLSALKSLCSFGTPKQRHILSERGLQQTIMGILRSSNPNLTLNTSATIQIQIVPQTEERPQFASIEFMNDDAAQAAVNSSANKRIINVERMKRLGVGGFGEVWLVKEISSGSLVAWKEMRYYSIQEKQYVNNEVNIFRDAHNLFDKSNQSFVHIVKPLGFFVDSFDSKAYLVMEYCSGGDLQNYIKDMKKSDVEITEKFAFNIIKQIGLAVYQLHSHMIIHGDLKPSNILFTEDFHIKLADFGQTHMIQEGRSYTTNHGGTILYVAPEILSTKIHEKKRSRYQIDIWAIGIILYELLLGKHPFTLGFTNIPEEEYIRRVIYEDPPELPTHLPERIKNPNQRITAQDILAVPEIAQSLPKK